jgi:hypothetical protein
MAGRTDADVALVNDVIRSEEFDNGNWAIGSGTPTKLAVTKRMREILGALIGARRTA